MPFFNDKPVARLAAGRYHSVVLLQNGYLYAFGGEGCCGISTNTNTLHPVLVSLPDLVKSVQCSYACTIVECTNNSWYAFGNANKQESPAYSKTVTANPSRIDDSFPANAVQVLATKHNFFLFTSDNALYVVGHGGCGEMGMGNCDKIENWAMHPICTPPRLKAIKAIKTGLRNFFVLYK